MVLHGHRGQVLAPGAEVMHVPARDHRKQGGKRRACLHLARDVARRGQDLSHARRRLRGHFLHAGHQDEVVNTRRHSRPRMEESRAARSAGRLEPRAGHTLQTQSLAHIGRQMILPGKRGPRKVSEVEGFHCLRPDMSIFQTFTACLSRQGAQIPIGKSAKRGFAETDDGYWSHIL